LPGSVYFCAFTSKNWNCIISELRRLMNPPGNSFHLPAFKAEAKK
jgi:hypothetical protein